jgi:hypothetical protein
MNISTHTHNQIYTVPVGGAAEGEKESVARINGSDNEDGDMTEKDDNVKCRVLIYFTFSSMKYLGFLPQRTASAVDAKSSMELLAVVSDDEGMNVCLCAEWAMP